MRIIFFLTLITLGVSCSKNTVSNTPNIKNEIVNDAVNIVKSHKNTEHIIKNLHKLDNMASEFSAYYENESLLTSRDKKVLKLTCSKILRKSLNECKKLELNLSDYERVKVIEAIEKSIDKNIDLLDYARKKIKLRIKK